MNGFLWLCERNGFRNVVPSHVSGLQDIELNRALNITFLNPLPHKHIPEPPEGVIMPSKVLQPLDIKPFPVLWHEDNGGRRQLVRERARVPGAISGPVLGEAAHRLLNKTLNIKSNNSSSKFVPPLPYHTVNRPRPAGPSGYERGFNEDLNHSHGHHNYRRGILGNPRFPPSPSEIQGNRENSRTQDRLSYQEQYRNYQEPYRNLGAGMSALTIESGRTRAQPVPSPRMPNPGYMNNLPLENTGPLPSPPSKWINKLATGGAGMYFKQQETASPGAYEKQVRKVYQIKTRAPQDLVDPAVRQ